MKTSNDPVFEPETWSEKIAAFIGSILYLLFVGVATVATIATITIIGVQWASAIWGDENVIYWISNLF